MIIILVCHVYIIIISKPRNKPIGIKVQMCMHSSRYVHVYENLHIMIGLFWDFIHLPKFYADILKS